MYRRLKKDAHLTFHYLLHYGKSVHVKGDREEWNLRWARSGVRLDLERWEEKDESRI